MLLNADPFAAEVKKKHFPSCVTGDANFGFSNSKLPKFTKVDTAPAWISTDTAGESNVDIHRQDMFTASTALRCRNWQY